MMNVYPFEANEARQMNIVADGLAIREGQREETCR
jgi:hypothetical protein